ncbi:MAG TPA: DUF4062 domain-containing protein [Thermoanaerobaculia bacterium]|nr:DUF4062 domain-containing protein [Thermoanaerobaculia bacterium]
MIPIIRVFVSSTWSDLIPERQAVARALERLRETKFYGMELFGSRSASTRKASLEEVDRSDVVVLLVGERYGSGITEAEYRRARHRGLPCLVYEKEAGQDSAGERETDPEGFRRLKEFRRLYRNPVRGHTVSSFSSPEELAAKVTADIHHWLLDHHLASAVDFMVREYRALPTDYAGRVRNFFTWYLGSQKVAVPFGGREDNLVLLDAWLDDPHSTPYLALSAPAGRGKSALLVQWSRRCAVRPDMDVVLFPISIRARTNLASVVFPSLVARLCQIYGESPPSMQTPTEVWRGLFRDYLDKPLPQGRRLLIILDGLDEAGDFEPGMDLFPLAPPSGLRVVVSARPRAGEPDLEWLRALGWERPGLAHAVGLSPLTLEGVADVLQRIGHPLDALSRRKEVIAELHRLSEGDPLLVGLYVEDLWKVRAKAPRIRPEDLATLRPGLEGYFDRWWDEQRQLWGMRAPLREREVQAVLGALSCAKGPLRRDELLMVAHTDLNLRSFALDEALLDLRRFVVEDGRQQGYVFSHPRLSQYQRERMGGREVKQWEEHFIAWGKSTLAALHENRLAPPDTPPYLVQYLGAHLEPQGVDALAALVSDAWRRAWEAFEDFSDGFVRDVDRAWRAACRSDQEDVKSGRPARHLGLEIRCALCRSSIVSLASQIPGELSLALVQASLWTSRHAFHYLVASGIPADSLAVLAPHLPKGLLVELLDLVRRLQDSTRRSEALAALAPYLPRPLRRSILPEAVERLRELGGWHEARALSWLAPHLPRRRRHQALADALQRALRLPHRQKEIALKSLAPHLPANLLTETWQAIRPFARGIPEVIPGIAAHLPPDLASDALQIAVEIDAIFAAELVDALASKLPAESIQQQVERLMKVARNEENGWRHAMIASVLLPYLDPSLQEEIFGEVFAMARETVGWPRAWLLRNLSSILPAARLEEVIDLLPLEGEARKEALSSLAPRLPSHLLSKALHIARRQADISMRARMLTNLVPHLTGGFRAPALHYTLQVVRSITAWERFSPLLHLLPHMHEGAQSEVLADALELTCEFGLRGQADALRELAPKLSPVLLARALEIANEVEDSEGHCGKAEALVALAPSLPAQLFSRALAITHSIPAHHRANLLTDLIPILKQELIPDAFGWIEEMSSGVERMITLQALGPHLPVDSIGSYLAMLWSLPTDQDRIYIFSVVAPKASSELITGFFEMALDLSTRPKAYALCILLPHLSNEVREKVIQMILALLEGEDDAFRAYVLSDENLIPHLNPELIQEALELACDLPQGSARDNAFWNLLPNLPDSLLPKGLEAVCNLRLSALGVTLKHLAPRLPEPLFPQALELASSDAFVLCALAPHLPEPLLPRALEIAESTEDWQTVSVLGALAPRLMGELTTRVLKIVSRLPERAVAEAITVLARWFPEDHLDQVVALVRRLDPEGQALAWLGLAPRLPEALQHGLLLEILESVRRSSDERAKSKALEKLSPKLPSELLVEVLAIALDLTESRERERALSGMVPCLSALSAETRLSIWQDLLARLAPQGRPAVLRDLSLFQPLWRSLTTRSEADQVFRAVQETGEWWP